MQDRPPDLYLSDVRGSPDPLRLTSTGQEPASFSDLRGSCENIKPRRKKPVHDERCLLQCCIHDIFAAVELQFFVRHVTHLLSDLICKSGSSILLANPCVSCAFFSRLWAHSLSRTGYDPIWNCCAAVFGCEKHSLIYKGMAKAL